MIRANIVEKKFSFVSELVRRSVTNRIIIHHTGGEIDIDAGAEQIHQWHLAKKWAGIGYHFVIRKDGTIERGRPIQTVGSHAYKNNADSIGIHLSGQFNLVQPTERQIESAAILIANLCVDFDIPTDRKHIIGHDECYNGSGKGCPGIYLQRQLDTISGKANWYRYTPADVIDR